MPEDVRDATASLPPPMPPSHEDEERDNATARVLLMLLQLLSKRTVALAGNLFPLIALGTGFALWERVLPEPSLPQLAGLAGYAVFMLLLEFVRRR